MTWSLAQGTCCGSEAQSSALGYGMVARAWVRGPFSPEPAAGQPCGSTAPLLSSVRQGEPREPDAWISEASAPDLLHLSPGRQQRRAALGTQRTL